MKEFFELNSPASKLLTNVCNLILVNLIFMITCLPIVTIGASLCGLYKVLFKIINKEPEISVFKVYLTEFKRCFLRATALWIPMIAICLFFALELYWILNGLEGTSQWMMVPILLVAVLMFCIAIYYFPLLAVFDNTTKETFRNSILLGIGNLPTTIMVFMIHFGMFILLARGDAISVAIRSLMIFCGFSLIGLIATFFINRTLPVSSKFEYDDEEEDTDETDDDEDDAEDEDNDDSEDGEDAEE